MLSFSVSIWVTTVLPAPLFLSLDEILTFMCLLWITCCSKIRGQWISNCRDTVVVITPTCNLAAIFFTLTVWLSFYNTHRNQEDGHSAPTYLWSFWYVHNFNVSITILSFEAIYYLIHNNCHGKSILMSFAIFCCIQRRKNFSLH